MGGGIESKDYYFLGVTPDFFRRFGFALWLFFLTAPNLVFMVFFDGAQCHDFIGWSPFFKSRVDVNPDIGCSLLIWSFSTLLALPLVGAWMIFPMHRGMPEVTLYKSIAYSFSSILMLVVVIYAFFNYVPPEGHIYYRSQFVISVFSSKAKLILLGWIFSLSFSAVFWLIFLSFLSPLLKLRCR